MANSDVKNIEWVAHRGCPTVWPENSLEGFRAALEAGAGFLECDIQITEDGVPVLFHDLELQRLTGQSGSVVSLPSSAVLGLSLLEPEHAPNSKPTTVSPLSDLIRLLSHFPEATLFIELKTESIRHFGLKRYLNFLLPVLQSIRTPFVVISFSSKVLAAIQKHTDYAIGWVIPAWDAANQAKAETLKPDWLVCNIERLPEKNEALWLGDWRWILYTLNDIQTANRFLRRGFTHLETNHILDMIHA